MMSDEKAPAHGATPPQLLASTTSENTCIAINPSVARDAGVRNAGS